MKKIVILLFVFSICLSTFGNSVSKDVIKQSCNLSSGDEKLNSQPTFFEVEKLTNIALLEKKKVLLTFTFPMLPGGKTGVDPCGNQLTVSFNVNCCLSDTDIMDLAFAIEASHIDVFTGCYI